MRLLPLVARGGGASQRVVVVESHPATRVILNDSQRATAPLENTDEPLPSSLEPASAWNAAGIEDREGSAGGHGRRETAQAAPKCSTWLERNRSRLSTGHEQEADCCDRPPEAETRRDPERKQERSDDRAGRVPRQELAYDTAGGLRISGFARSIEKRWQEDSAKSHGGQQHERGEEERASR